MTNFIGKLVCDIRNFNYEKNFQLYRIVNVISPNFTRESVLYQVADQMNEQEIQASLAFTSNMNHISLKDIKIVR